jgi:hypothetical protein
MSPSISFCFSRFLHMARKLHCPDEYAHVSEGHMPHDPLAPVMPVADARTLSHNSSARISVGRTYPVLCIICMRVLSPTSVLCLCCCNTLLAGHV